MAASEPHVRGIVLKVYREVLAELYGVQSAACIVESLAAETRELWTGMIVATEWYPNRLVVDVQETIVRTAYAGDPTRIRELGIVTAKRDLSGVFKVFLAIVSPQYVVSKTASMWSRYYDHGKVQITEQKSGYVRGRFTDVKSFSEAFWNEILGSCMGAIEAAGGKSIQAAIVAGGTAKDSSMEAEIRWD